MANRRIWLWSGRLLRSWLVVVSVILPALACQAESAAPASAAPLLVAAPAASASATAAVSSSAAAPQPDAAPPPVDDWIPRHLRAADERAADWLGSAAELRLQILVTIVSPGAEGEPPRLEEHGFRVDAEYIYPASAIKTFLAVATLRYLAALGAQQKQKVDLSTARIMRCRFGRSRCEPPEEDEKKEKDEGEQQQEDEKPGRKDEDQKKKHDKIWVHEEVHKLLAYSDNDSYDRLYDIIGHEQLNRDLSALGFASVRFHHRMNAAPTTQQRMRRVLLLPSRGRAVELPVRQSELALPPTPARQLELGTAYYGPEGRVAEPMSFAAKNYASLRDLQRLNLSLLWPAAEGAIDLGLGAEPREIIVKAMTGTVSRHIESQKPMVTGVLKVIGAKHLRYINKAGRAYGFHLENAYLEDTRSGRGVLVTAAIYANENGVLNDDNYGYAKTTHPFMRALGYAVARAVFGEQPGQ